MPAKKRGSKKRWVLSKGYVCTNMGSTQISIWTEWGEFGPKALNVFKIPEAIRLGTKVRLILEEI